MWFQFRANYYLIFFDKLSPLLGQVLAFKLHIPIFIFIFEPKTDDFPISFDFFDQIQIFLILQSWKTPPRRQIVHILDKANGERLVVSAENTIILGREMKANILPCLLASEQKYTVLSVSPRFILFSKELGTFL